MQACPECGQQFDGDQCWVCVNRDADIEETFSFCFPIALAGLLGIGVAMGFYPPLEWSALTVCIVPAVFLVPAAIVFPLMLRDRLERYAVFVRLVFVSAAAIPLLTAGYYFLNGALDGNPSKEVPALVSGKWVNHGKGSTYNVSVSVSWSHKQLQESIPVGSQLFSAVEPGDSVRVTVHAGAFSTAWYGEGALSTGDDAVKLNSQ